MNKKTILIASGLCVLGLLGAGCADSTPTANDNQNTNTDQSNTNSQTGGELDACKLLTKSIATEYLGDAGEPDLRDTIGIVSTCTYSNPATFDSLMLLVRRSQTSDESDTVSTNAKAESKNLSGVDPEDVSGLGDSAYWAGGDLKQINVFKNNDWLILSTSKNGFTKDQAIEIMKKIINNY